MAETPEHAELAPWEAELLESARQDNERLKREADTPIYFEAYTAMRERFWEGVNARVAERQDRKD